MTPPTRCRNPDCEQPAPPDRKGYCLACYWAERRNRQPRTPAQVERHHTRMLDRILANHESHA